MKMFLYMKLVKYTLERAPLFQNGHMSLLAMFEQTLISTETLITLNQTENLSLLYVQPEPKDISFVLL